MISEGIVIAAITGACAVVGEIIISARNTSELYSKIAKQSELADERMEGKIAVLHTELSELRKNVEKHNSVIERTYNLEKEVARQGEQIKTLFGKV